MKVQEKVSVNKVKNDAEEYFRGGYFCCEAVMASIRENFELDVPKEVIAMASGMCAGKVAEIVVRELGLTNTDN